MALLERLFAFGSVRQTAWRLWYPFLMRRLWEEEVQFLNCAFEEPPPTGLALEPAAEPNRASIQLYHHVANQAGQRDREVVEVSGATAAALPG
jgi:hypothetical protein